MTFRSWIATWAEIGSLIAEHISEGFSGVAKAIDPPPAEIPEETVDHAWIVQTASWCDDCNCTHQVRRLYTQTGDDEPTYRGQASDHQEGQ